MEINTLDYPVIFGVDAYCKLSNLIKERNYSKIYIITDDNVSEYCLPHFLQKLSIDTAFEIIEIESGEEQKNIQTCIDIWNILSEFYADRNSLIINIGGGVVSDLGGFIASTYKRGVDFVNVPTTLLSMVDASVGGKTGINTNAIKNTIGTFAHPQMVLIDVVYLQTLSARQMRSGLAEMYKHALIADGEYWKQLTNLNQMTTNDLEKLVFHSVNIKNNFVKVDWNEKNIRKALNFGHTLGHSIETYSHKNEEIPVLLHGEAIAIGMILESFLSFKANLISHQQYLEIKNTLKAMYDDVVFSEKNIQNCIDFSKHDKKNTSGEVQFVLLSNIGQCIINQKVPEQWIYEAFEDYHK